MKKLRILFKVLLILLGVVILAVAIVLGWLTATEYKPADVETVAVTAGARHDSVQTGKLYRLATLNVGYAGLGRDEDFFMDGGKGVQPKSEAEVSDNLSELLSALSLQAPDICFLQETDVNSKRSYYQDESDYFARGLSMGSAFAYNYRCAFVPFPWPPIGQVESGITTLNNLEVSEATRESLPVPFSWPLRIANLKRCLLVERLPLKQGNQSLVLVNLHLEAYSSEDGRKAQMQQLFKLMKTEVQNGNYVIAGGDFNQAFPGTLEKYPLPENPYWVPGLLSEEELPDGFRFAFDMSTPTCRALDKPYDGNRTGLVAYVIDGFIVSSNVKVNSVKTIDLNFRNTDHQPVVMEFTLQ
ncbi:MAG TPA: endonuclease [Candidatus Limiplasma sp.]|nr:endonuclease [Candidatus Limiplasma sp.]HPS80853.1 endonuclease [Candidatus Limiplasma sp.]